MKINVLIKKLEQLKKQHGNIEILFPTEQIDIEIQEIFSRVIEDAKFATVNSLDELSEDYRDLMSMDNGDGSPVSEISFGEVDECYVEDKADYIKYIRLNATCFPNRPYGE